MVDTSYVENVNTPYEFLATLLDDHQTQYFYENHTITREQNFPIATRREEWHAFQRAIPPEGVPVDDKIATEMANKFVDLGNLISYELTSGLTYIPVAPCRSEDLKPVPAPDGVIVDPEGPGTPELDWRKVYILSDFSPHWQLSSSVEAKYMEWARFIRAKSTVPREIILGIAFDANKFRAWAVVEDGKLLLSPTVNLPRAPESQKPASPEDLEMVLQFLDAVSLIFSLTAYLTGGACCLAGKNTPGPPAHFEPLEGFGVPHILHSEHVPFVYIRSAL